MPRTARAAVGGMCYHVLNRGNNRAEIFHSAADYARFVALLGEAQAKVSMEVFAACLMPNHFHLVVRPRADGDLGVWIVVADQPCASLSPTVSNQRTSMAGEIQSVSSAERRASAHGNAVCRAERVERAIG